MNVRHTGMMIGLALSAVLATAGAADGLPSYYPTSLPRTGTIDRLDLSAGALVINDTLYQIQPDAKVHTPYTRFGTLGDLAPGQVVGIAFSGTASGRRPVGEIWVMPRNWRSERERHGR